MKDKRILLLPKYTSKGPSSRYRIYQYVKCLESEFNISVSPFFSEAYILNLLKGKRPLIITEALSFIKRILTIIFISPKNIQLVIIEYELVPYFPSLFEALLKWKRIKFITVYDDAVFHRYDRSKNFLVRRLLSQKIRNVMKYSSALIVGNKYLEKYALDSGGSQVYIIPTVIDYNFYPVKKQFLDTIKIVWIGSPSTSKYLNRIENVLLRLVKKYKFELVLIGAGDLKLDEKIIQRKIDYDHENESSNLSNYDIGIMPLFDSDWERGKCGFKLIQYMASGLPTIADEVGVNKDIIIQNKTGFLCNSEDEWFNCFERLLNDKNLRQEFGNNGVKRARKLYSLQATQDNFLKIVKEVLRED